MIKLPSRNLKSKINKLEQLEKNKN